MGKLDFLVMVGNGVLEFGWFEGGSSLSMGEGASSLSWVLKVGLE